MDNVPRSSIHVTHHDIHDDRLSHLVAFAFMIAGSPGHVSLLSDDFPHVVGIDMDFQQHGIAWS
jgi:hypothetical protein